MLDIDDIASVIASSVKEATAPLIERIAELEARELPEAIKGDPGEVDMEAVEQLIVKAVGELPKPKDGAPGEVDMEAVKALVDKAVGEIEIPQPEKGDAGEVNMDEVAALVDKAVAALPPAKDGVGLADAIKDQDGELVLVMTDGRTKSLGKIDGKDGEKGKDGESLSLDDFDIETVDERTIALKFTKGEICHAFELEFPVIIDRGVWKAGEYQRGDAVSWGGSLWIAQKETSGKPDTPDSGWRLAVKRGRDGKNLT